MNKLKNKNRYYISSIISLIIFIILALILYYRWINQYNERLVNKIEPDPIRQLIYPLRYIPIISLIYWLLEWNKKYRFIIPFITAIAAFILEYLASDWWKYLWEALPRKNFFIIWMPSFIAALVWVWIVRIIAAIIKAIKSKNKK